MPYSLKDKRIVIIGGTSGIGRSVAISLHKQGARVVIQGLPVAEETYPEGIEIVHGDLCEGVKSKDAIDACVKIFGGFDGLLHVAGGSGRKWGDGPLHEITQEGWDKTLQLNLTTLFQSNQAAIRQFMADNRGGSIVNISSVLATHPAPHFFATHAYTTAKSAIIGFSKSIAAYYSKSDIRVNVIAPALTDTPMAGRAKSRADIQAYIKTKQPLDNGRLAKTSDIVGAACYFLSDESRFTTGQVLAIDGGWSVSEGQYGTE
ncbi:MAG: SDR family oxidoreductase [Saprospiraceae bacterium]|nr:SDR family oxidoreductase [Saprospiraceae bacterium]